MRRATPWPRPSATLGLAALVAGLATAAPAAAGAQSFGGFVLSPRVVADYVVGADPRTFRVDEHGDTLRPLVAVVLWRGETGWVSGPRRGINPPKSIAHHTTATIRPGANGMEHRQWVGGQQLVYSYDPRSNTVNVLGQALRLASPSVVLVDGVAGDGTPNVVEVVPLTHLVLEPRLEMGAGGGSARMPAEVLRDALLAEPKVANFLR